MELKSILEAILFSAQHPLTSKDLRELLASAAEKSEETEPKEFRKVSVDHITEALEQLAAEQEQLGRSYRLMCVAGAWQFATRPDFAPWIKALVGHKVRPPRLSQPALETLAIIAYRQPITRADVEAVRGVNIDGVLQTLMERGLVKIAGRAEIPGRPLLYETTQFFLDHFGLRNLDELPNVEELRSRHLPKAPGSTSESPVPTPAGTENSE